MQYRSDRKGTKLSVLGYGCLRFTKENGKIDIDKTEKEIMEAIRSGVNYFDTAYVEEVRLHWERSLHVMGCGSRSILRPSYPII